MILRQSKSCKGCGAFATEHSPTCLNNEFTPSRALAVAVKDDPLVIERTVNQLRYGIQPIEENDDESPSPAEEMSAAGTYFPKVEGKTWNPKSAPVLGAGKYQASSELMETLSSFSDSIDSSTDSYEEIQKMSSDDISDSSEYDNYSNSDSYSSSYSASNTETSDYDSIRAENQVTEQSENFSLIASDPDAAMPSLPEEEPYLPAAPSEHTPSVIPSSSIGKIPGPKFGTTSMGGIGASAIGAMAAAAGMRQLTEAAQTVKDNNEPQPEVDDMNRYADAYNPSNSAFIPEPRIESDLTETAPESPIYEPPKDGPAFQPEETNKSQTSTSDREKQTAQPGFFDLSGDVDKEKPNSEEKTTKNSGTIFDATPPAEPEPAPALAPPAAPVEEVKPVKKRAVMNQNFFSATMNEPSVSIRESQDVDDSNTRVISDDSRISEDRTVLIKENSSAKKKRSEVDDEDADETKARKNTGKAKKKKAKDPAKKSSAIKTKRRSFSSKKEDEEDLEEDEDDLANGETDDDDDDELVEDESEKNEKVSKKSVDDKKSKDKTAKDDKNSKNKNDLLSDLVDLTKKEKPKSGPKYHDRFSKNSAKEPVKTVTVLGRTFSQKFLITIGLLVMMAGFPSLVLISTVYTIFHDLFPGKSQATANSGGTTAQGPSPISIGQSGLSGKWDLAFQNQTTIEKCSMNLEQRGNVIQGLGADRRGPFQIGGTVNGTTVNFTKVYVQQGQVVGKPIQYQGVLSTRTIQTGPVLQLDGKWEVTKRQGYSWRAQVVTYSGPFQARLTAPSETASATGASTGANGTSTPGNTERDPKKAHGFFFNVAIGIVGIGVAIAMLSLKFFGPSGLLNIWAKKEYIPSQFKAQHFKMVKEMGKPLRAGDIPLGMREEWGLHQFWLPRSLCLPSEVRDKNPHILIVGAGATGKSRLLASMAAQDIKNNDRAVVVIDSDGSLADLLLDWIASQPDASALAKRVLVVDPTNNINETTYNPLEFPPDGDLQNTASALVFGFKAAYTEPPGSQTQWNQQTANILRNCAVLLMANNKTLTDLPVLLSDNDFRDVLLEKVEAEKHQRSEYITLVDAWTNYKRLARTDQWITWIEPILNRVQPMLSDPRLRTILTKPKSDLDLREVICQKQVLIVKIPQGHLDRNGNLLGSLMVAGLKQAALSLSSRKNSKKRHPCSLYLDELDSFIEKETFDSITTETRKLQIGFCGTSKTLQTLPEDFRNQLIINVGVIAIFALAKKDADMLGPQMFRVDGRKVKHQTIQNVFNKVNSSPQFELIMDEEKLNIDRVVGQEKQTYFCYRVGTVAGVFRMKSPIFDDAQANAVNQDILERLRTNRQSELLSSASDSSDDSEEEEEDDDDDGETAEVTEKSKNTKVTKSSKSASTKSKRKAVKDDDDEVDDNDDDDDENLDDDDDDDDDDDEVDDDDEDEESAPRNKKSKARLKKKR